MRKKETNTGCGYCIHIFLLSSNDEEKFSYSYLKPIKRVIRYSSVMCPKFWHYASITCMCIALNSRFIQTRMNSLRWKLSKTGPQNSQPVQKSLSLSLLNIRRRFTKTIVSREGVTNDSSSKLPWRHMKGFHCILSLCVGDFQEEQY